MSKKADAVREELVPIEPGLLYAFTDGSTWKANPGPIAWAVVFVEGGLVDGRRQPVAVAELSGAHAEGTNNLAELMAATWALEHQRLRDLVVVTDSILIYNICRGTWQARSHRELYERFARALAVRQRRGRVTEFRVVKGHNRDPWNRRADQLAKGAAAQAHGHLAAPPPPAPALLPVVPAPLPPPAEDEDTTPDDISHETFLAAHRADQLRQSRRRTAA